MEHKRIKKLWCAGLAAAMILTGCTQEPPASPTKPDKEAVLQEAANQKEEQTTEQEGALGEVPAPNEDALAQSSSAPFPTKPANEVEKPPFYDTMQIVDGSLVYSLSTAQDLVDLAEYTNQGGSMTNTIFVLENDIDMSGIDFTPIGTPEHPFTADFLGQGHKITNLSVKVKEDVPAGFFGVVAFSHIRELDVEGEVTGYSNVGGFAGQIGAFSTTKGQDIPAEVNNASFRGKVNGSYTDVGGFAGSVHTGSTVAESYAEAAVTGQESLGGFVGTVNQYALISQCYARGEVQAAERDSWKEQYGLSTPKDWGTQPEQETETTVRNIGGFAGMNVGDIFESYTMSAVKTLQSAKSVGAFIGYDSGRDGQCVYLLDANSQWTAGAAVGGDEKIKAKGMTAEEMKDTINYTWDFHFVWYMSEKGYPIFKHRQPLTVSEFIDIYKGAGG